MCLASAFVEKGNERELVLDKTTMVQVEGDLIICTNLFGEVQQIKGSIKEINFEKSSIIIAAE